MEEVSFLFGRSIRAVVAPFFVAKNLGYFAEESLSVSLLPGVGTADTLAKLTVGKVTFSNVEIGTLTQMKATEEVNVKQCGAYYLYAPCTRILGYIIF